MTVFRLLAGEAVSSSEIRRRFSAVMRQTDVVVVHRTCMVGAFQ
jgi:hypothetical protein